YPFRRPWPKRRGRPRPARGSRLQCRRPEYPQQSAPQASNETPPPAGSGGLFHAAGADAGGANADLLTRTIYQGPYTAKIGVPAAARHVVRVADRISIARLLAANFTCHCHLASAPKGISAKSELSILANIPPPTKRFAPRGFSFFA